MSKNPLDWAKAAVEFANKKKALFLPVAVVGGYLAYSHLTAKEEAVKELPYSEFYQSVTSNAVTDVELTDRNVTGHYKKDNEKFSTYLPQYVDVSKVLLDHGVKVEVKQPGFGLGTLASFLPMLLMLGFILRHELKTAFISASKMRAMGERPTERFSDVAGIDESKAELQEVVEFLKDPNKFSRLGGRMPKGVLLVGPPGTGKTLVARAVAGEANVPFFSVSGSEFVEMYVGVGASRVRDMFAKAKKKAPCIIFIDEIDALGRNRDSDGSNSEHEQTINQMLVEMDGFAKNNGIILIGATNRPDMLDKAFTRPGRFDRQVVVPAPDVLGREKILEVHTRNTIISPDVDLKIIARGTPGFSGADLANLVNEAALRATRLGKESIGNDELDWAKDKVLMGTERRSMVMTPEERELTAYHEAGHALVALHSKNGMPLHKVTIIPRGRSLGHTMSLPEDDGNTRSLGQMEDDLARLFGGREAEKARYGEKHVTTGAMGDIEQATKLARQMVMRFGMSEEVGRVRYFFNNEDGSLMQGTLSSETASMIEKEVRRFIKEGETAAAKIMTDHRDQLDKLAHALLKEETLTGNEVRELLGMSIELEEKATRPSVPISVMAGRADAVSNGAHPI